MRLQVLHMQINNRVSEEHSTQLGGRLFGVIDALCILAQSKLDLRQDGSGK